MLEVFQLHNHFWLLSIPDQWFVKNIGVGKRRGSGSEDLVLCKWRTEEDGKEHPGGRFPPRGVWWLMQWCLTSKIPLAFPLSPSLHSPIPRF